MRPVQLLALLLALGAAPVRAQNGPAPTANAEQVAIMDRIERDVRLPRGAGPPADYERYYTLSRDAHGRQIVAATWLRGGARGRRWVAEADMPMVSDGGCDILSFTYNPATQVIGTVLCNGIA